MCHSFMEIFRNDIVVVFPSHGEDDHFTLLVGSVLLMCSKVMSPMQALSCLSQWGDVSKLLFRSCMMSFGLSLPYALFEHGEYLPLMRG